VLEREEPGDGPEAELGQPDDRCRDEGTSHDPSHPEPPSMWRQVGADREQLGIERSVHGPGRIGWRDQTD
jgi:hypothetical protein